MSTDPDPMRRLDDPDFPALTMSQAAELLGVQAGLPAQPRRLRSARSPTAPPAATAGTPATSSAWPPGCAGSSTTGTPLASAEAIVDLQDQLADARADADRLRSAGRG